MMKRHLKFLLFLFWLVLIGTAFYLYRSSGIPITEFPQYIRDWIAQFGIWGPLVYISLYALRTLTLFSATAFTIASGIIFGPWLGMLYTIVGENLAANLAFVVGRYFGKDVIARAGDNIKFFPKGKKFQENGFMTVLMMRLLFFPFDWVGYLSGAYNIRQKDFAVGTFIGILPGLIAFVALGGAFSEPLKSIPLFIGFFILGLVIARIVKKKTKMGAALSEMKEDAEEQEHKEKAAA